VERFSKQVSIVLVMCLAIGVTAMTVFAVPPEKAAKTQGTADANKTRNVILAAPLDDYLPAALWIRVGVHHPVTGEVIDYVWKLNTCAAGDRTIREECYRQMMRSVYVEVSPRHPSLDLGAFGATMPITFTGSRVRAAAATVSAGGRSSIDPSGGSLYMPEGPIICDGECHGGGGSCETVICSPDVCGTGGCGSTCLNCLH